MFQFLLSANLKVKGGQKMLGESRSQFLLENSRELAKRVTSRQTKGVVSVHFTMGHCMERGGKEQKFTL